ncbi:MAG: Gfo/Idh/MocA family protein [Lachnospiraceae bacterium]
MRTYNIGILGAGVISRTYLGDIQAFYKKLKVVACADIRISNAEKLADEYKISKAYTVDDLLQDDEIEIVINLTPPQFHVELARQIIAAGKHLFSEKPFAPSVKEAGEILDLAKKMELKLGVLRIRFWHPVCKVCGIILTQDS